MIVAEQAGTSFQIPSAVFTVGTAGAASSTLISTVCTLFCFYRGLLKLQKMLSLVISLIAGSVIMNAIDHNDNKKTGVFLILCFSGI